MVQTYSGVGGGMRWARIGSPSDGAVASWRVHTQMFYGCTSDGWSFPMCFSNIFFIPKLRNGQDCATVFVLVVHGVRCCKIRQSIQINQSSQHDLLFDKPSSVKHNRTEGHGWTKTMRTKTNRTKTRRTKPVDNHRNHNCNKQANPMDWTEPEEPTHSSIHLGFGKSEKRTQNRYLGSTSWSDVYATSCSTSRWLFFPTRLFRHFFWFVQGLFPYELERIFSSGLSADWIVVLFVIFVWFGCVFEFILD